MNSAQVCSTSYGARSMLSSSLRNTSKSARISPWIVQRNRRLVLLCAKTTQNGPNSNKSSSSSNNNNSEEKAREMARGAQSKLKELYTQVQESASRTWVRMDSEYSLSSKAERASKKAEETWRDVDQTYNVRRKVRNSLEYIQRKWPTWQRQLDEFATTWYGKTTLLIAIVAIISSPIFWRLLNILLLVWWLALPVAAAVINSLQRRAAARAQEQAEEEARKANPFSEIFRPTSAGASRFKQQDGPVIEAEYVTIPKDDK